MKFDVFVSFRAIDTRRTFVSHLLFSLFESRIRTFKCEEEVPPNQPASSQVLQAIEESKIAIVVISKNYTASVSCLDELSMIIECMEKQSLEMVPVLYEVDPSYVLSQADNFEVHGDGAKAEKWKDALLKSIQIYRKKFSHWEDEDSYSYIIETVMLCVHNCLYPPLFCSYPASSLSYPEPASEALDFSKMYRLVLLVPTGIVTMGIKLVRAAFGAITGRFVDGETHVSVKPRPAGRFMERREKYVSGGNELSRLAMTNDSYVGMDRHMKAVTALLDSQAEARLGGFGICGVQGVGKTTLARYVYEQISPQFQDHYYFMKDTKTYSTCLLEEITRAAIMPMSDSESESLDEEVVKAKLGHQKVLLIADDLHLPGQLNNIKKFSRWFGLGSRVILISEFKQLLQGSVESIYEVESMRYDEALQLFSRHAFKQEHVPRDFYQLSVRAVLFTGRIPLPLKVLGSFFCGKCDNEWKSVLCKLEASQVPCVARVSGYIANAFS